MASEQASKICLSLEKSKRLVELGVIVYSYFEYIPRGYQELIDRNSSEWLLRESTNNLGVELIPAPTLQELLEVMPDGADYNWLTLDKYEDIYSAYYMSEEIWQKCKSVNKENNSPIEALGDLAIYLLENNLWRVSIKTKEIKEKNNEDN